MAELSHEPVSYEELDADERPSLREALVPTVGLLVFLGIGAGVWGMDPHMPLVWSLVLTGLTAKFLIGRSWDEMYEGIVNGLEMGIQAILILLIIYMLVATWISAATIPGCYTTASACSRRACSYQLRPSSRSWSPSPSGLRGRRQGRSGCVHRHRYRSGDACTDNCRGNPDWCLHGGQDFAAV